MHQERSTIWMMNVKAHFEELKSLLDALNIPYEVDTEIVRGLDSLYKDRIRICKMKMDLLYVVVDVTTILFMRSMEKFLCHPLDLVWV